MKKIYLSALSLVAVAGLNAQVTLNYAPAPKHSIIDAGKTAQQGHATTKAILWSNDFTTAADWGFTNTSVPAQNWVITSNQADVPTNGPWTSANGNYLLIDSDTPGPSATQDAYATYQGATAINLSGEMNVTLEFSHHYRTYLDERIIEVSGDGGTTWVPYVVTDGTETGIDVDGIYSVDISATAAGVANVKLRFHYIGAYGWHWAIDDVKIKTTEPYDLKAVGSVWGVVGAWGPLLPYYNTPTDQIQPVNFCGINKNVGINDISDATYTVNIPAGSFTGSGSMNSLAGVTDTICATTTFTPAGNGTFVANASMSTTNPDTGTLNNEFEDVSFDVVPFIYARDIVGSTDGGSYNQGDGFEIGNIFDVFDAADLETIQVGIDDGSEAGASIYVKLYTIDATTGDFILEDQSAYYTLTAGDLGSTINLVLLGGAYTLSAGEPYLITVGSDGDGGLTNDLVVSTSGDSEAQTTFYYDATDQTWYYSTSTPVVRMNFDPTSSLQETTNVFEMGVFPNPANAQANVMFNLNNAADVNVTVTDLSGKVVYTEALGTVNAGTTEVSLNTGVLSNGVYMVNVIADNAVSTEKLVVRK